MNYPVAPAEVDPRWLEEALTATAMWPRVRVRGLVAERIGVGFGLDGVLARLRIEGEGPASVIAKWSDAESATLETRFYRLIAPRVEVDVPAFYGSFVDEAANRALLLLEDVAPARQGDMLVGASPSEAMALVEAEAALHAAFWNRTETPEWGLIPPWVERMPGEAERTRQRLPMFLTRFGGALSPSVRSTIEGLPDRVRAARAALTAAPNAIIHADLHLDNVLFRPSGRPVLLDWTDISRGPAAVDFARLLLECLAIDTRRAHQSVLADNYVGALAGRGVVDYDRGCLERDVAQAVVVTAAWIVRWAGRVDDSTDVLRVRLIIGSLVRNLAALLDDIDPDGRMGWT